MGCCSTDFPPLIKYDLSVFVEENYPAFNREINQLASQFQKQQQELYWVQSCHLIEAFMIITSPTYFDKEIKIKYESDLPLSIELSYMSMLQEQLRVYLPRASTPSAGSAPRYR